MRRTIATHPCIQCVRSTGARIAPFLAEELHGVKQTVRAPFPRPENL